MSVRQALPPAHIVKLYGEWIRGVAADLDNPRLDRNETAAAVGRDLLPWISTGSGPADCILKAQLDPRNITFEAEYYGEMDPTRFYRVKPLLWLWRLFDMSPLGQNIHLGLLFRGHAGKTDFQALRRGREDL